MRWHSLLVKICKCKYYKGLFSILVDGSRVFNTGQSLNNYYMIRIRFLDKIIEGSLIGFVACSMFSISLTQLFVGVGGLTWLVRVQIEKSWKQLNIALGWFFLAFVVACFFAVITSVDPPKSIVMLKKNLLLLKTAIYFLYEILRKLSLRTTTVPKSVISRR